MTKIDGDKHLDGLVIQIYPVRQQLLDCKGHALVVGGPGRGKTTIALKKAVKRIQEGMAPGQSVMFLSFSRAATARIAEASKVEATKAERSLLEIQTFHSFFWGLLRSHLYLLGSPRRLQILFPHDERALSGGIGQDDMLLWEVWIAERDRLCREDGRIAFDLFAPLAATLLGKSAHLRRLTAQRHPLLIIDEAQDTGPDAWRCVKLLAQHTQVLCLADLEQQIFDYLPGIDPARIDDIKQTLAPLCIDLGSDNYRGPGLEIAIFGRDILSGTVRRAPYAGVSTFPYNPKFDKGEAVRRALGWLQRKIRKETGDWGRSIAILVPSGASAARLSKLRR
jgi:DNA helicase-2/ATP-dependent DNA helicase PcrA